MYSVSFSNCYWPFCFTSTLISSVGIFAPRDKLTHALKPLETHQQWSVINIRACWRQPGQDIFAGVGALAGRLMHVYIYLLLLVGSCKLVFPQYSSFFSFFPFLFLYKSRSVKKRTIKTEFYPCWNRNGIVSEGDVTSVRECLDSPRITSSANLELLGIFYWMQ